MDDQDKTEFKEAVGVAYEMFGKAPSSGVMNMWWMAFSRFTIADFTMALSREISESKFLPTIAGVLEHLKVSDGRPDVDEAWAIAKQAMDERSTVVWTDEIAEAYGIASEVYGEDRVGGRMAFKSSYDRVVEQNKRNGTTVTWWATLGDPETRQPALEQAEAKGLLSHEYVVARLPSPADPMADSVVALLFDDKRSQGADEGHAAKSNISILKTMLGGAQ